MILDVIPHKKSYFRRYSSEIVFLDPILPKHNDFGRYSTQKKLF